ncbi:predicted protein [Histoplasma capsulatum var. duboisii H88]|uniref:Predicted protein n=1 Tax=Ajellomyces capsulatus (strain H88) TaxID=544711 RepID=F0UPW0_AJEC8|nr:predicted protein [Histoplasma capsulatum var. duboisii H88]
MRSNTSSLNSGHESKFGYHHAAANRAWNGIKYTRIMVKVRCNIPAVKKQGAWEKCWKVCVAGVLVAN